MGVLAGLLINQLPYQAGRRNDDGRRRPDLERVDTTILLRPLEEPRQGKQ